ncbi:MAG: LD-carboxypeptidase [Desulfatiglandaceae bacterium]|jgi:muramoyltetrapeptide carboxypeptidase
MKHLPIIKPPGLRKGDLVGLISPAGPVEEKELKGGLALLDSKGLRVRLGAHVFDRKGYLAGEDASRLDDFHGMFSDPEVRAVFCTRGGYGTLRLLDKIQYDLIRKNPKILVGFSDVTSLLMALLKRTGLVTFHGSMFRNTAERNIGNIDDLLGLLGFSGNHRLVFEGTRTCVPGNGRGPLIGGNLNLISHLLGTPFLPSFSGCILFLEDIGEPLYRVDRMLTHLRLSGLLEGLRGIVAGEFKGCGEPEAIDRLLTEIAEDLHIPLISGFPLGHGFRNIPLPLGVTAELDTAGPSLTLMESCVT